MRVSSPVLVVIVGICFLACNFSLDAAAQEPGLHRVHTQLLDPREHPDYARRAVQPPSWDTFGNRTHFTVIRGFGVQDGKAAGYAEEMERYVDEYKLGDVLWPSYDLIFVSNLADVLQEIKRRNLYLFDIWGYVPGSGPGGYWQQFHPPAGVFDLLESTLGERWLGMDIGEQDGRYVGGYAPQMYPISRDRFSQYVHFQRHFDRMTTELGNKNATLVSLNFGHYFLKEGVYTCIGAETAQGLPNGQVYYSFIRGAGKQYGVPWFGNASVWNRWGWKTYDSEGEDHGPTKGTSLSLLKRLMYSHVLYNCLFAGFESGWFSSEGLTPIGRMQQAAVEWVDANGQPGTLMTPVALMLDFYAGWTFPRHLYTDKTYRVWGNLPYEAGDHLADGVLDMLYPGYQDSSFYHDERGFLSATPYGDIADCILSDAPGWLLDRYPLIIVAGELAGGAEIKDKLEAYVAAGGRLVITAGNVAKWPDGLCGIRATLAPVRVAASDTPDDVAFDMLPLALPKGATVESTVTDLPLVAHVGHEKGLVTVLASPFGLPAEPAASAPIRTGIDAPLANPFPLLPHARAALDEALTLQALFTAGDGLSVITCRRAAGEYTLAIANNSLEARSFAIESFFGSIVETTELPLDQSEKTAPGYLPTGLDGTDVGASDGATIAGGDIRLFRVRVNETNVEEIPHVTPPARPQGRFLPLRDPISVQESILARPMFFEHFDGLIVDWRYLHARSLEALAREQGWLQREGLRLIVDLTSGINLYPDLRIVENDPCEFAASMTIIDELLAKAQALNAEHVMLSLHRTPENNFTHEQTLDSFEATLRVICQKASEMDLGVLLRPTLHSGLNSVLEIAGRVAARNLRVAPSLAMLVHEHRSLDEVKAMLGDKLGLWLASAVETDLNGTPWTAQAALDQHISADQLVEWLNAFPATPIALDAVYADGDAEYSDIQMIETASGP